MLGGGVPPLEKVVPNQPFITSCKKVVPNQPLEKVEPNCNKDFAPLLKKWIRKQNKNRGWNKGCERREDRN